MGSDRDEDRSTSPAGLLKCLCMVAEEAAALRLPLTLAALREAIEACVVEGRVEPPGAVAGAAPEDADARAPVVLH